MRGSQLSMLEAVQPYPVENRPYQVGDWLTGQTATGHTVTGQYTGLTASGLLKVECSGVQRAIAPDSAHLVSPSDVAPSCPLLAGIAIGQECQVFGRTGVLAIQEDGAGNPYVVHRSGEQTTVFNRRAAATVTADLSNLGDRLQILQAQFQAQQDQAERQTPAPPFQVGDYATESHGYVGLVIAVERSHITVEWIDATGRCKTHPGQFRKLSPDDPVVLTAIQANRQRFNDIQAEIQPKQPPKPPFQVGDAIAPRWKAGQNRRGTVKRCFTRGKRNPVWWVDVAWAGEEHQSGTVRADQLRPVEPPTPNPTPAPPAPQRRRSKKGQASGWIEERTGNRKRKTPSTSYYYGWQDKEGKHKRYIPAAKVYRVQQMIQERCPVQAILLFLDGGASQ